MDGTLVHFRHAALCAYGERERPASHGTNQLMKQLRLPYHNRVTDIAGTPNSVSGADTVMRLSCALETTV